MKTDVNRDIIWELVELAGLTPVMIILMDETWSALRIRPMELVKRKK